MGTHLKSAIVLLILPCLFACEIRTSTETPNPEPPASVERWTATPIGHPAPNSYHVRLSWSGLKPANKVILRSEGGRKFRPLARILSPEGELDDNDVIAGESYEYRFEGIEPGVAKAVVPIDESLVTSGNFRDGRLSGFNRVFFSALRSAEPIYIQAKEIICEEKNFFTPMITASGVEYRGDGTIDPGIRLRPIYEKMRAEKQTNGRNGHDVTILAEKLKGTLLIDARGQDGGDGDTKGGEGGNVYIDVIDDSEAEIQVFLYAAHGGGSQKSSPGTLTIKSGGKEIVSSNRQNVGLQGIYQSSPTSLITADGQFTELEWDGALFQPSRNEKLFHSPMKVNNKGQVFIHEQWRTRLSMEVLSEPWKLLHGTMKAIEKAESCLYPEVLGVTTFKEGFSAYESFTELLQLFCESKSEVIAYLKKNEISKVEYEMSQAEELRIEDNVLVVPVKISGQPQRNLELFLSSLIPEKKQ